MLQEDLFRSEGWALSYKTRDSLGSASELRLEGDDDARLGGRSRPRLVLLVLLRLPRMLCLPLPLPFPFDMLVAKEKKKKKSEQYRLGTFLAASPLHRNSSSSAFQTQSQACS